MSKKKIFGLILAAVIVIGISSTLYIMSHNVSSGNNQANLEPAMTMLEFKVTKEDLVSTLEVKGKSSYQKETRIYAPFNAAVLKWNVTEGAQVKKGEPLFELDAESLKSEIAAIQASQKKQSLEASLEKFTATAKAVQEGQNDLAISEQDSRQRYTDAERSKIEKQLNDLTKEATSESLALSLKQKQSKVSQALFNSPEDGIFLYDDSSKIPQLLQENERIGKIVDLTKLQLVCTIGEFDIFHIQAGMAVQVKVDAMKNTKLQGKVEKVSKFAKSGSDQGTGAAQFEVIISLEPHEKLIAGLSLTGSIETEKKNNAVVVPTLAVQRENESYFVMLQTPQGTEKRVIEIGMETAEKTEVIKGLAEGDTVVLQ
ncbi:efflux RND transporter periplasmic adaptor subunit [Paenibacillus eucommiae]|uniref:Macrolide-specific efflux system membrane fusion protein n=1 Tax=Paenibacillus eucommiae TaxID=1355755 RepID=A0ABS4INZ4_9BACL|nr:efflux RND transporter periplasmic adaptor subunit [Paenibacillus eucommiae]MBP1989274.1 macrolide-specific efflux system membrane fusion protein [Paenibacillus eucommiae]